MCPSIQGRAGTVYVYGASADHGYGFPAFDALSASPAPETKGYELPPDLWGFTGVFGLGLMIFGARYNPFRSLEKRLQTDLDWLKRERKEALSSVAPPDSTSADSPSPWIGMERFLSRTEDVVLDGYRAQYEAILRSPLSFAFGLAACLLFGVVLLLVYAGTRTDGYVPLYEWVTGSDRVTQSASVVSRIEEIERARAQRTLGL
jgi:hypothetical protein